MYELRKKYLYRPLILFIVSTVVLTIIVSSYPKIEDYFYPILAFIFVPYMCISAYLYLLKSYFSVNKKHRNIILAMGVLGYLAAIVLIFIHSGFLKFVINSVFVAIPIITNNIDHKILNQTE